MAGIVESERARVGTVPVGRSGPDGHRRIALRRRVRVRATGGDPAADPAGTVRHMAHGATVGFPSCPTGRVGPVCGRAGALERNGSRGVGRAVDLRRRTVVGAHDAPLDAPRALRGPARSTGRRAPPAVVAAGPGVRTAPRRDRRARSVDRRGRGGRRRGSGGRIAPDRPGRRPGAAGAHHARRGRDRGGAAPSLDPRRPGTFGLGARRHGRGHERMARVGRGPALRIGADGGGRARLRRTGRRRATAADRSGMALRLGRAGLDGRGCVFHGGLARPAVVVRAAGAGAGGLPGPCRGRVRARRGVWRSGVRGGSPHLPLRRRAGRVRRGGGRSGAGDVPHPGQCHRRPLEDGAGRSRSGTRLSLDPTHRAALPGAVGRGSCGDAGRRVASGRPHRRRGDEPRYGHDGRTVGAGGRSRVGVDRGCTRSGSAVGDVAARSDPGRHGHPLCRAAPPERALAVPLGGSSAARPAARSVRRPARSGTGAGERRRRRVPQRGVATRPRALPAGHAPRFFGRRRARRPRGPAGAGVGRPDGHDPVHGARGGNAGHRPAGRCVVATAGGGARGGAGHLVGLGAGLRGHATG